MQNILAYVSLKGKRAFVTVIKILLVLIVKVAQSGPVIS